MDIKRNIKDAARQLGLDKGTLKKAQVQAIEAAVRGNDVFLVAPTGFGKSAVFQATALLQKGVTVVIVPLLSLLRDQVGKLRELGISAGYFCSEDDSMTKLEILLSLEEQGYLMLYTTPESLHKLCWLDPLIRTLVVDECHCVTMWGYTFREAYLAIGPILRLLSHRPVVIAMTATAPPEIRAEIEQLLSMDQVRTVPSPTPPEEPDVCYPICRVKEAAGESPEKVTGQASGRIHHRLLFHQSHDRPDL